MNTDIAALLDAFDDPAATSQETGMARLFRLTAYRLVDEGAGHPHVTQALRKLLEMRDLLLS